MQFEKYSYLIQKTFFPITYNHLCKYRQLRKVNILELKKYKKPTALTYGLNWDPIVTNLDENSNLDPRLTAEAILRDLVHGLLRPKIEIASRPGINSNTLGFNQANLLSSKFSKTNIPTMHYF